MVIATLAVLTASVIAATPPPLRLVEPKKAFAVPMFHPPSPTSRTVGLRSLQRPLPTSGEEPSFICHITVIKADPEIDPKMVVEAPTIGSKIVRRSMCAEPSNE